MLTTGCRISAGFNFLKSKFVRPAAWCSRMVRGEDQKARIRSSSPVRPLVIVLFQQKCLLPRIHFRLL